MVFIESVELTNFKSYHHTRYINKFLQTNAIVGPNGTGKSNILDAITFAFGDISKNLRVEKLKDLIHLSHENVREKSCSVRLRLTFPNEDKVHEFERRLNDRGADEFYMNGNRMNKQDYIGFLESRGIFAKHDNFVIRQGSINKMIQDGDNNRTKFIDVVSGGANYEPLCKEYQKAYDEQMKNLKAHQDTAQQTGTELYRLGVAQGVQKDMEDDMKKLNELRLDHYLLQMYPIEQKLQQLKTTFEKQMTKLEAGLTEPEDELSDAHVQKQGEMKRLLSETKEMKTAKSRAEAEYVAAKAHMECCNQQIVFLENKVSISEKFLKTLQAKSQEQQDDRKEIEKKIADLQKELQSLEAEHRRKSQSNINEGELAEFHKLSRIVEENRVSDDLRSKEERLETLQKEFESLKISMKTEEEKLTIKRRELSLLETNDPEQATLDSLKSQVEEIEREIEQIKANEIKRAQYHKEIDQIQLQLADQERTAEYNNKERMRDQIERDFLEKFPNRVFGILKKICSPLDESYTLAGTRVFQKWKNAFVVNSAETAGDCIKLLKQRKFPPQKFIPVDDALRIRQVTPDIQAIINAGKARLVRDCFVLRHDNPIVGRAVDFVCGTILICDTAQQANDVSYKQGTPGQNIRFTTVSKSDGTMFSKNGKITGGAASLSQHGDPFNPSQLQTMLQRKAELIDLLRTIPRSEGMIIDKQARTNQLRQTIAKLERERPGLAKEKSERIENVKRFIQTTEATVEEKRSMIEVTETKIRETQNEIEELKVRKEALIKDTFAEFCKKNKITDLSAFQNEDVELQKSFSEKKTKISNEIKNLQTELQYIIDRRTSENEKVQNKYQDAKKELDSLRSQIWLKAREECDKKHNEFAKINTDLAEREVELDVLVTELQEIKTRLKKIKDVKNKMTKLTKERDASIDPLMNSLQRIFFECRYRQLSIPLINATFESIELFEGAGDSAPGSSTASSARASQVPIVDCKGDYSRFDEYGDELNNEERLQKITSRKWKSIEELEQALTLKEAGAISVEDFNERIKKARETEKQNLEKFAELSKKLTASKRQLDEAKTERKNLFVATLKKMQKDVDYFYKILYNDPTAQAYLNVVGSDEPYNSKVLYDLVVPGKQRTSIDSLSGGEKAMAILALLFAGKPSRVNCILMDEFDEALDRRNMNLVSRFIDFMSTTRKIQFVFISHRLELYAHANQLVGSSIHCKHACNYGSILFTVDVRDYLGDIGHAAQYNPDDENEVARKKEATEEFTKALECKGDEEPTDERIKAEVEAFMEIYASQEVKAFINGIDSEDASQKCPNNPDVQNLKEIFNQMSFENF